MEILPGFSVSIDMAFEAGEFRHGALGVDFPDPGFPIGDSGVFLTHIDGSVDNPAGGPFQVTANVRLGAEPDLPGIGYLLTIDGGAGVTFGDTPSVHITGDARLIGVTLANGDLTVSGNGSFSFRAHIDQRLLGVMGVASDFSGGYVLAYLRQNAVAMLALFMALTAHRLLHLAPCPVLVVPPEAGPRR